MSKEKSKEKKSVSGKAFDWELLKRIFTYTKPYRPKFYRAVFVTICLTALAISRPLIIRYTADHAIKFNDLNLLTKCAIALLSVILIEAALQFSNIYLTYFLGQQIIKDMRNQLYKHVIRLRTQYFDKTPVGMIVTRTVSDIESLSNVFSEGFIVILGDLFTILVFMIIMLVVNWKLALVSMSTIPILILATNVFKNGIKKTFQDVRNQVAKLNTFVQEHITGMKIVQVFNREEQEYKKFETINKDHRDANIRSIFYYSVFFPVVEMLTSISLALLVYVGGLSVMNKDIDLGNLLFFTMLINMLFRPIRFLADRLNTLQMGMVAAERVFKVLDTKEAISNTTQIKSHVFKGHIEFRNVWFAYNDENWILKGISFEVQAGEKLAIVGSTGSGKSTIINLIGRYYEFQKGDILIDGIDIRAFDIDALRSSIGMVLQDVFLFSDTIYNNITLFDEKITLSKVQAAARIIHADRFIDALEGKYEYNVKERGVTLSVGQRQLISFIRAYVHKPSIFILDEATSSIDTESEFLIQQATEIVSKGRTSIIIAHRLATIRNAEKVLVMEHGKVVEFGSPDDLLEIEDGKYKKLFSLQYADN
jgi:ATP-binding cassette, subfamily B, multidrug efflux pump